MKKTFKWFVVIGMSAIPCLGVAQGDDALMGIRLGEIRLRPEARLLGAYDSRVASSTSGTDGDYFGESSAALYVENTEAKYHVGGEAMYGYRFYDQYRDFNDRFYDVGASIASHRTALKLDLAVYKKRTLDYDFTVDDASGEKLGAILTPEASERLSAKAGIGYEKQLTDKTAILPAYEEWYYHQSFDGPTPDAEWREHIASLRIGYGFTSHTVVGLLGSYSIQEGDDEDGHVGNASVEARSRATDKIEWSASAGVASADYEESGTEIGAVGVFNVRWLASDKISAYAFGEKGFQQGYGGSGARRTFRAGYGADWRLVERLKLDMQVLHDYQESIDSGSSSEVRGLGRVRHFLAGQAVYDLTGNIELDLTCRYINDEQEWDQTIVSAQAVLRY